MTLIAKVEYLCFEINRLDKHIGKQLSSITLILTTFAFADTCCLFNNDHSKFYVYLCRKDHAVKLYFSQKVYVYNAF